MDEPIWKIWLSYLAEIRLESAASAYNPHLQVSLKQGRYQLSTAHAVYSYGDLYSNFDRAFQQLNLDQLPGDAALILGFGLGSIPLLLEKKFDRRFHYTAVEIDETVLELANRYTMPDIASPIDFVCADAAIFLETTQETFDLICMDIFQDDTVPPAFEDLSFLKNLKQTLSPEGLLLYNRLAATGKDVAKTKAFFEQSFLSVFPQGKYLDVKGNWILVSDGRYFKKLS